MRLEGGVSTEDILNQVKSLKRNVQNMRLQNEFRGCTYDFILLTQKTWISSVSDPNLFIVFIDVFIFALF